MSATMKQLDFKEFETRLTLLCNAVSELICHRRDLDITRPIFYEVARTVESVQSCRRFFLTFAHGLLAIDGGSADLEGTDYAEYLAATSLALYFLGEPFSQPWEHVLKWVEQSGGGLPNGVCVGKAIGDIVRSARITNRAAAIPVPAAPANQVDAPLLILSNMPMILHRSYATTAEVRTRVPVAAHVLGHCYELLQIRLYAHQKLPFRYFIPTPLIKAKLLYDEPGNLDRAWRHALEWMCRHVFPEPNPHQLVIPIDMETLPPVFLNMTTGLYTSPRAQEGARGDPRTMPLPATYLRSTRLQLYRHTLNSIPFSAGDNLLQVGRESLEKQTQVGHELFGIRQDASSTSAHAS